VTTAAVGQSLNGADPGRERDHFSLFMVTVAFAVYAVGVIVALVLAGHVSDLYGRRRMLLPAVCISIVSAIVFLAFKALPGLLAARPLSFEFEKGT
jgi:MFS family permease